MNTFFVSTNIDQFRRLLQSARSATLLIETLYQYRAEGHYLLHEFVVMPDHIHLIVSPQLTIEKSMQLIKGGFAFQARKRFQWKYTVWHRSFHDRRLRDAGEYSASRQYIHENPVRARLCERSEDWPYSSASGKFELDALPQWLKPLSSAASSHA